MLSTYVKHSFLVGLVISICSGSIPSQTWTGDKCGVVGNLSNAICISPTQYILEGNDTANITCPMGTFCVDHPKICVNAKIPACRFPIICNVCSKDMQFTCVTQRKFVGCVNGVPDSKENTCQSSMPYCSMLFDHQGVPSVVCTNKKEHAACEEAEPVPEPQLEPAFEPATKPQESETSDSTSKSASSTTPTGPGCSGSETNCPGKQDIHIHLTISICDGKPHVTIL